MFGVSRSIFRSLSKTKLKLRSNFFPPWISLEADLSTPRTSPHFIYCHLEVDMHMFWWRLLTTTGQRENSANSVVLKITCNFFLTSFNLNLFSVNRLMFLMNQCPAAFQCLCACIQPHRSACMAAASSSCLVRLFFFSWYFFSLHPLSYLLLGLEFPWGPKPFAEVVAGPLLRNNRQTTDSSSLEGHYVGVYFSAHWVSRGKRR